MDTRTLALIRAARILGGAEALAGRLGTTRQAVRGMLEQNLPVPQWVFLHAVDIISDPLSREETAV